MYLVLIETSGNQNYIFSTNKLKENIGASELTYRAGTEWVLRAVRAIQRKNKWWKPNYTTEKTRQNLLDTEHLNLPLENSQKARIEILVATSGKALILVRDRIDGKRIVQWVTKKVLRFAPGVDICGVISDRFDFGGSGGLAKAIAEVHKKIDAVKSKRPSNDLRFMRLPIVDECATSGLPAARMDKDSAESDIKPYSAVSLAKRKNHDDGEKRIAAMLKRYDPELKLSESLKFAEAEETQWLAIVHADGNGLGEIFLSFDKHLLNHPAANINQQQGETRFVSDRFYADRLREFSIALDICTEKAFVAALKASFPEDRKTSLPIAPLVLGGDDLTVVCDAQYALEFTVHFLKVFEEETKKNQKVGEKEITIVPELAEIALGVRRLSACAGIAIVKPHFPFSVAYHLAEQLLKTAKTVKTKVTQIKEGESKPKPYPCSAIDFHILYDSSGKDLDTIRKKQQVDRQQTYLYNSPYVVTPLDLIPEANGQNWATHHDWEKLYQKAEALKPDPEDKKQLPNGQVHALRSHLYMGKEAADGYYKLIKSRYDFKKLLDGEDSLFSEEPEPKIPKTDLPDEKQSESKPKIYTTSLLDAMDVMTFLNFDIAPDFETEQPVNP
jgi:hypothetical protein